MVARVLHGTGPGQASLRHPPPRSHLPHGLLADASEHGQGPRPVSPGQDYPALLSNLSAPSPHPTPRSLPTSFPPKHSLIHSPDHLQTTHLPGPHSSCPAQLPGIMAAPPPPSQDPPPSLITTLAPPGQARGALTSVSAWKSLGHRRLVFLWTSRGRSKLETLN